MSVISIRITYACWPKSGDKVYNRNFEVDINRHLDVIDAKLKLVLYIIWTTLNSKKFSCRPSGWDEAVTSKLEHAIKRIIFV